MSPTSPVCPNSIVFIDNVVSSGSTFDAARHQLHAGWGLAYADARRPGRGQSNRKRHDLMGLGYSSSEISRALSALESTPSGRSSGPPGASVGVPPVAVQRAALKGLKIRAQSPGFAPRRDTDRSRASHAACARPATLSAVGAAYEELFRPPCWGPPPRLE